MKTTTWIALTAAFPFALGGCAESPFYLSQQDAARAQVAKSTAAQKSAVSSNKVAVASQNGQANYAPSGPQYFTQPQSPPAPKPEPRKYSGPHHYNIERNGMYGYTDSELGQVHFFRYDGIQNGHYVLFAFEGIYAGVISCTGDCQYVDIASNAGHGTFAVRPGSVLHGVVKDMLAGALIPSR